MVADLHHPTLIKRHRDYNAWVADETLEDYALRYASKSFRRWSEWRVANTAFGSIAFLMLEAMGGFLVLNYGFANACLGILAAGTIIFLIGLPVCYHAARCGIDMDLLTRGAGFGYVGSTFTSLIYAAFTFTLFALEASILSQALELGIGLPLAWAHVVSALVVIPCVTYGITWINRLQLWTQPLWLVLLIPPYLAVLAHDSLELKDAARGFDWLGFGTATTMALAMVAQIGEQVDFLRFLPDRTAANRRRWWAALLVSGPGWIVLGVARQLGGALLVCVALGQGVSPEQAYEPVQMFLIAYQHVFTDPSWALYASVLLVIVSQIKINVTNAYAGSLAWSNFFSRLTHCHPGRVVWLVFNVAIALLLMEFGVFGALEQVLGLFSNVAVAWFAAVAAMLAIAKPLGLSPPGIEFKRSQLPDLDLTGVLPTLVASGLAIAAHLGMFGEGARAFSALIALVTAFALVPVVALLCPARHPAGTFYSDPVCAICGNRFEPPDMAHCPAYQGSICSLCCTLESRCLDACKPGLKLADQLDKIAASLPLPLSPRVRLRLLQFALVWLGLVAMTGVLLWVIYYQDLVAVPAVGVLWGDFLKLGAALWVFLGLAAWWLVLNNESRRSAQEEASEQTLLLFQEIEEHYKTQAKLKQAMHAADQANQAKSRFLLDLSHEVRTPLNSILGYAQILAKDPSLPPHRRDAVSVILSSGEHLASLIEDVSDIARIEARKLELKRQVIDFPALVEQLARTFRPQAQAKGLAFRCQLAAPLPQRVLGDEKRLRQILINLIGNAVKFTRHGEVLLRIQYNSETVRFEIIDTGPGIPEEELETIFLPFRRLRAAGDTAPGHGLGLTISKVLVEIMGGELTVSSAIGRGSTFMVRLFLPRIRQEARASERQDIIGYRGPKRKILVVDDQEEQRWLLESVLAPLGFAVLTAENGETCLSRVRRESCDLILLDLAMAGLDGLETVCRLRQEGFSGPILIVSANAHLQDRQQVLAAGADDFLVKPIRVAELLERLGLHLGIDWIAPGDEAVSAVKVENARGMRLHFPPPEILASLRALARIGDLHGLARHLRQLTEGDTRYLPFADRLQSLICEFRLREIQRFLEEAA